MRSATKPLSTPRASSARFRTWIPTCLLLIAVTGLFLYIGSFSTQRIGDGAEYQCMAENWTRNFTPWLPMDFRQSCAPGIPGFIEERGDEADAVHFWLLPLLTAPFWIIFQSIAAYTAVHWAMLSAALVYASRRIGSAGSALAGALLMSSPLIWWSNKAHAEIFICTCLLLAFLDLGAKRSRWAALWFALAAAQQSTIAPFSIACLAFSLIEGRLRRPARSDTALSVVTACVLALPSLYTFARYGVFSTFVFTNSVDPSLISLDRAVSLFVDPDIGLLPHWPPALAAFAAIVFAPRPLALFALAFLAAEPFFVSTQRNWNSGGTVHLSRYALYFIPPLVACFTAVVTQQRHKRPITAALLVIVTFVGVFWNWPRFRPDTQETYLIHTDFAQWLYREHPHWYDPIPEIFIERTGIGEGPVFAQETWAVGVPSCMKLLLVKPLSELPRLDGKPQNPPGCLLPNEADLFYKGLLSGALKPNDEGYINVR